MKRHVSNFGICFWAAAWTICFASIMGQQVNQPPPEQIQELSVVGFRAGLVTDIPSAQAPNNSLRDVQNYVFTNEDGLAIRKGFVLWNPTDTTTSNDDMVEGLFGFYRGDEQSLIAIRRRTGTTAPAGLNQMNVVDISDGSDSIEVFPYVYRRAQRDKMIGSFWDGIQEDSMLTLFNAKTNTHVYDGVKAYPIKPLALGQPGAISRGPGNIGPGMYKYRYLYKDVGGGGGNGERTFFSTQSKSIYVDGEAVLVYNIARPRDETKFDADLYRTKADGNDYFFLVTLSAAVDTIYLDNTADGSLGAAPPFAYGDNDHVVNFNQNNAPTVVDSLHPPGSPSGAVSLNNDLTPDFNAFATILSHNTDHRGDYVAYWTVLVDSSGVHSAPSAAWLVPDTSLQGSAGDTVWGITYATLAVPTTNSNVKYKLALRKHQAELTTNRDYANFDGFSYFDNASAQVDSVFNDKIGEIYVLETLGLGVTSKLDNITVDHNRGVDLAFLGGFVDSIVGLVFLPKWRGYAGQDFTLDEENSDSFYQYDIDSALWFPESLMINDSAMFFTAGSAALYKGRIFATADPFNLNQVFYSQARSSRKYALSNVMNFPTEDGDKFMVVRSVEDGILLFKQNNLFTLRGSSIVNFQADKVFDARGTIAPRSVLVATRAVTYLHDEGIFRWNLSGVQPIKISAPIQSILDSLDYSILKWASAITVDDDYWLSVNDSQSTTINNTIYIFDVGRGAWLKFAGFGFQVAEQFDTDRSFGDWHSSRYVFGSVRNRLFRYGYNDFDTLDGPGAGVGVTKADTITTLLQTKFFFAGQPGHRKVFHVDVSGEGIIDSCKVTLLGDLRVNTYDTLGTAFRSSLNFTTEPSFRFHFLREPVAKNISIVVETFTGSKHVIKGLTLGYVDWDRKKDG